MFRNFIECEHYNLADYCLGKMKGYTDSKTGQEIIEAYDYMEFMGTLFQMNGK